MSNRLAESQSPYLLQHKDNPVDWHPWGEEAFQKARDEEKPLFLSIGYSTCHWCHVMEHESFEDEEVARLINDGFVPVKVDREERPDIDSIYMRVCQMMSGQGGWPLTIIATPDGKPFHATTYVPKHGRFGRMGLMELLPKLREAWETQPEKVRESAESVTSALRQSNEQQEGGGELEESVLHQAFRQLEERYDPRKGGFGSGPKFPTPHHLLFLLRYWKRTGNDRAQEMVRHTLDQMRLGGMYDHIGYGFHRYSTDTEWLLPHFEKMLYDQALLITAYVEGYQVTGREAYAQTVREVITYLFRDMQAPEGAFYSAEDADSEGREGKFYVWTASEVRDVLDRESANLFLKAYNFEDEGNFVEEATGEKTGENIPHLRKPISELAAEFDRSPERLEEELAEVRRRLFERREERVRPGRDDKILTDWNGLVIAALARAGRVLGEDDYVDAARKAARFIMSEMHREEDGRLLHRYREGEAGILAHLDDYGALIWGLIELYQAGFEAEYLEAALDLQDELDAHFWDEDRGGYFFTADDSEELITRQKELYDGAQPSGNAMALLNLLCLARLTGRSRLEERADALMRFAAPQVEEAPAGFTATLLGLDFGLGPGQEIVVAGSREAEDTRSMLQALQTRFLPHAVLLLKESRGAQSLEELAPFVKEQDPMDGRATAYVCQNFRCGQPTTDIDEMLEQLEAS